MAINCPKCQHENPEDTLYCGKCGSPLKSAEGISVTKTLVTRSKSLQKGGTLAGRYKISSQSWAEGGWVWSTKQKTQS